MERKDKKNTVRSRRRPLLCAGLDFRLFPVGINYLPRMADFFGEAGFSHVLIAWGGSFPFSVDRRFSTEHAYPEEVVAGFMRRLKKNGIQCLHLLPVVKDMSSMLSLSGYGYLQCNGASGTSIDPLKTGARSLMEDIIEDMCGLTPDVPLVLDIRGWEDAGEQKAVWNSYLEPLMETASQAAGSVGLYVDAIPGKENIGENQLYPDYLFLDSAETAAENEGMQAASVFSVLRSDGKEPENFGKDVNLCIVTEKDFSHEGGERCLPPVFQIDVLLKTGESYSGKKVLQAVTPGPALRALCDETVGEARMIRDRLFSVKKLVLAGQKCACLKSRLIPAAKTMLLECETRIRIFGTKSEALIQTAVPFLEGDAFPILLRAEVQALEEECGVLSLRITQV